ncbi:Menaquinone reductase [Zhongshania aliphaticivorans]|uniref:Menaquinone reductase n=1 Tax=Zhongshania aliphaticivorans TaxID=1470434 RepID=A0A5S9NMP8_9GAMM|nr:NAD(P)/FAD-dependent oxidoreductase [Zhongshania aliphaticivorans]CAA0091621.1 Menaquinone reductase [Zhongshania aliphaticivorans]CAA0098964.1 Menaquinone reductase [Zhongshania aliphaticivorans]
MKEHCDVAIIGAGPAGSVAAALLCKAGHQVVVLEQSHFPRFSIGESLLPQCMVFLEEAGMLEAVNNAGFQFKNGAAFSRNNLPGAFDFTQKFSEGPGTTFQVQRADFDHLLANQAISSGADIRFGKRIDGFGYDDADLPVLNYKDEDGEAHTLHSNFVLDASGFGRVLPRLLDLEMPSDFPVRRSLFTHIEDNISDENYDRNKILIVVHPEHKDVWYWLIPFSNGRCSLGVVAAQEYFDLDNNTAEALLKNAVHESPELRHLLSNAQFDTPISVLGGYACKVKSLWGKRFALLGNAAEFLDPVFSSGVTIAMKSASLAAPLVNRQLSGQEVDWQKEYAHPLQSGIDTFRAYVNAWYDGSFQDVIFSYRRQPEVRGMICSILAGYAWDQSNPFVSQPKRLQTVVSLCQG